MSGWVIPTNITFSVPKCYSAYSKHHLESALRQQGITKKFYDTAPFNNTIIKLNFGQKYSLMHKCSSSFTLFCAAARKIILTFSFVAQILWLLPSLPLKGVYHQTCPAAGEVFKATPKSVYISVGPGCHCVWPRAALPLRCGSEAKPAHFLLV